MLFDLRGRKRNMVRFVYGGLAILFMLGFVGFGIGSEVGGGLFGGGGHGGGGGHSGGGGSPEDQLEAARETVESDPEDAAAWERLSILAASAAQDAGDESGGHGGGQTLAEDGFERLGESVFAYERYVALRGERRVSTELAQSAARSYATLNQLPLAVDAQRLATDHRDAQSNALLAQYAASAGDLELTQKALDRAIAAAPRGQRAVLERQRGPLRRLATSQLGSAPGSPPSAPSGGHR